MLAPGAVRRGGAYAHGHPLQSDAFENRNKKKESECKLKIQAVNPRWLASQCYADMVVIGIRVFLFVVFICFAHLRGTESCCSGAKMLPARWCKDPENQFFLENKG